MNILITGGAGFIGSNLAKSLLEDGHNVMVIDNFFTGRKENLKDLNVKQITLDLSDSIHISTIDKILQDIDVVYHFAASIGVKLIQEHTQKTFKNSFNINNNLFPLCEQHGVKVIFASTSEVYGETKNLSGSKETDKLEILSGPRGSYAASKLFSEFLVKSCNFPSVIVRFFNVVGPSQVSDFGHVLPKFIETSLKHEDIKVYGYGDQIRSFCDIRDAIEMLKLLLDDKHNGQTYNIGNDKNIVTINELASTVKFITNSTSNIINVPLNVSIIEDIHTRYPNTDKIKQYYTCKYNIHQIIRNIYEKNFNSNSTH